MIKQYKFLFTLAFFVAALATQAQGPITVGVSSHFTNFTTDSYFPPENWQIGIAKVSLGVPLTEKLTFSPSFAFGNAKTPGSSDKNAFWDFDFLSLQYTLTTTKLQPFLSAGAGVSRFNSTIYGSLNGGLGLNYWITEKIALTAQTNYDALPSFVNYWHNSIGLTFKLKTRPKDSDKDGIPDVSDACPLEKGTAATNGCPDKDMDGIADKDDACPDVKGTAATKGCPDADADGIADAQDKCPNEAGKIENNGCPDTDGDGVIDKDDACPQVAGLSTLAGCPDGDGDGVADKDDACPTVKGPAANKGCPNDRDKDGVADEEDNCPDVAGIAANKGCPEIKEEEKKQLEKKLNMAAKLIQFETGSATIKPASFKELDEIVNIMNQYPASKFKVEGHTDNTGNAANNTALSGKRADAVKAYISGKGINESRLSAEGFGSSKPIGSNTTAAGRTQNRRVEIHLME
jgi:OmpA-OmpF porin, OOP family